MSKARIALLTIAMASVALAGCMSGAAASTLYVKDALTDDVAEVHVTFTKAQVKPLGGAWVTVFDGKESIELLSLSSADAKASLAAFDLAPGQYEGLRIAVSEVMVVGHDGNETLLNVFGNIVSIADDFTVGADGIDILVDFDLEQGVDLEAGTYTPVVKNVQTSDDDHDGDGIHDVDDVDDDDDGVEDNEDDDRDGDGEDDKPRQHHGKDNAELCAAERDEELAEADEELDESLADAAEERDQAYADAEERRQKTMTSANATPDEKLAAQDVYEADIAEADAEYEAEVAEAHAEHEEEVEEAEEEHAECLTDGDDADDDSDDDSDDDADDDSDDDADDHEDGREDESHD